MQRISNDFLIIIYKKAKELNVNSYFITLLEVEIKNRNLVSKYLYIK
ncbi:sporulation histidine kinase inhibitor Sda [Metabacillus sp. BG109]|uniref:Sporulation histidine kinase inhibitor Sda n=1 Tax=Metabacillus bambusae TaxID=2795218 RepID=A0ABS3N8A9_9BACI|nr:sporulation histidine kinase inhibitor Sda [Metabacillus bambusae]